MTAAEVNKQPEHRIVDSELMSSLTMQVRYTCACDWYGYRWNEHAEKTGATKLPPPPQPPRLTRQELRAAIYGERRR